MKTYLIINIGDLMTANLNTALSAFQALSPDQPISAATLSQFLSGPVAEFRVGNINETEFRQRTCALLDIDPSTDTTKFNEAWCSMCVVTQQTADLVNSLLSFQGVEVYFHSGTNALHHAFIVQQLNALGVKLPSERCFLSYELRCAYNNPFHTPITEIVRQIRAGQGIDKPSRIVLGLGTATRDDPQFAAVAAQRNNDIMLSLRATNAPYEVGVIRLSDNDPLAALGVLCTQPSRISAKPSMCGG